MVKPRPRPDGWSPSPRRRVTLRAPNLAGVALEVVLVLLVLIALRLLVMRYTGG